MDNIFNNIYLRSVYIYICMQRKTEALVLFFFMELFVKLSWDPRSVIIILFVMHGHVFTSSEVQPRILMQYV